MKAITTGEESSRFRQDILDRLRGRVREVIEATIEEELADLLGGERYERTEGRRGYRNGVTERTVTTVAGTRPLEIPPPRVPPGGSGPEEFPSKLLPPDPPRSREIDEAIVGIYLAGANSRGIRKALEPLLGSDNLSKSAVSRVVGRLKGLFEQWSHRDLSGELYPALYLDGFHLKVRIARRIVSVPVLAVLGVAEDGTKVLISLRLTASEAAVDWSEALLDFQQQGLVEPLLIVI